MLIQISIDGKPIEINGESLKDLMLDCDLKIKVLPGPIAKRLQQFRRELKNAWQYGIADPDTAEMWPKIKAGPGMWKETKAGKLPVIIEGIKGRIPDMAQYKVKRKKGRPRKK